MIKKIELNYIKKLCKIRDIEYIEKNKDEYSLILNNDQKVTFPRIYMNQNELIGGYTELVEYLKPEMDYQKIKHLAKILTYNLNKIIDYNYYPIPETQRSNFRHRPIGLGVQGLANVFYRMKTQFGSDESKDINKKIFESIYYGSLEASMEIARDREDNMKIIQNGRRQYDKDYVGDFISIDILSQLSKEVHYISEEFDRDKFLGTYSSISLIIFSVYLLKPKIM